VIESAGALVVADDVNNGSRSFRHSVPETDVDPLEALAGSYATVPCAFNTSIQDRLDFISEMIVSHKVDGVIFAINRNCETEAFSYPELEKKIKASFGIPTIHIETDYMMRLEPFRDRVEAFLQLLGT
jgi:benzoyl-CoA reductase/2-hydroxyglutaryl-CoA dehydratase subunit BcrC/BadD/HgdB